MAATLAAVQAILDANASGNNTRILRHFKHDVGNDTFNEWYVTGNMAYPGVTRWVRTNDAGDAATQAAAIEADLALG